jgi:hypothetical protein
MIAALRHCAKMIERGSGVVVQGLWKQRSSREGAHSVGTCVSPSPSKIPYGEFSPVRLQTDCRRRPSPLAPLGSMQSTSPGAFALYAATAQAISERGPCGLPLAEPLGPIGTIRHDRGTSVQRPLARQQVMLSRRVYAYYGLIRASGCATAVALHRLFSPEELLRTAPPEGPQFTPPDCTAMPPPLPRWPAECAWLSLLLRLWPSPREYGLGIHIKVFEAAEFA